MNYRNILSFRTLLLIALFVLFSGCVLTSTDKSTKANLGITVHNHISDEYDLYVHINSEEIQEIRYRESRTFSGANQIKIKKQQN